MPQRLLFVLILMLSLGSPTLAQEPAAPAAGENAQDVTPRIRAPPRAPFPACDRPRPRTTERPARSG